MANTRTAEGFLDDDGRNRPVALVAAEARFCQIQRVIDLIVKVLVPDKATASNFAPGWRMVWHETSCGCPSGP